MEAVKYWIRNIAVVAVVAGFLEILLPHGDMQRFARLVVGFFILMAIIQPLVGLFHQQATFDTAFMEAAAAGSPNTATVLAKGREMQARHDQAALEEYRLALERQVAALAAMTGVEARAVAVDLDEDRDSDRFGTITAIGVVIGPAAQAEESSSIVPVSPVQIDFGAQPASTAGGGGASAGTGGSAPAPDPALCASLARSLAGYYGLPPSAVSVTAEP